MKKNRIQSELVLILIMMFVSTSAMYSQVRGNDQGQRGGAILAGPNLIGKVIDSQTQQPLEYATVTLFSMRDSSLVTGGITDPDGKFEIQSKPGQYFIKVEFISFTTYQIPDITLSREVMDLGAISLESGSELLADIVVRAEKSETQFSLDKRVFNVGKDLANRGGTAEDILDNVPSVTVDIEGAVSLRGSEGVRILIDGRPSGLVNADNANGLRSIPADMIDKVEVVTNPSARYGAEGMAGIINIVLKKQTGSGFNGSLSANGGFPEQVGAGANLNYRNGKVNWFANYGLRHRTGPGGGNSFQQTTTPEEIFYQDQTNDRNRSSLSNSIRFGIDFIPDEKQTLTGSFSYRKSDEDNLNTVVYRDYINDYPNNLTGITTRTDDGREKESDLEYSVNYTKSFSSREHVLKATVQYEDRIEREASDFLEEAQIFQGSPIADLVQRSNNDEGSNSWLFQLDYTKPLGDDHKYELGMRTSLRGIDNDYVVEELQDGLWSSLAGLSNDFNYNEDVTAVYGIYGNKINKFSFQVGVRGEYSQVLTELLQTNEVNDRNYFGLFPSTHINYEFGSNNAAQISYSRRIRRPRFWDLNPFFTFSDSRNTFSGNPDLDPEYTDSYEVGHIKYWDQGTISASFFYRHTTGTIERILTFNPDGTTTRKPQNLATRDDYGLELTFQYSGLDWLRLDGNANFFRSQTNGQNVDASFSADNLTWFGRLTSRITFWQGSDMQIRLNYRAPRETTQGTRNGQASLDVGWSKDIMNKQGTLTLSVRDLFNSRRRAGTTVGENFFRESEFQWRSRSVNLSFNYRINQKKKRNRGGQQSGGEFQGQDVQY